MARSVRISEDAARVALGWIPETSDYPSDKSARRSISAALARLDRAPPPKARPKRKPRSDYGHVTTPRFAPLVPAPRRSPKESKRERRAAIREACLERADWTCECGCGRPVAKPEHADMVLSVMLPELDHFFGRGKGRVPETVETCWILRADCHREKTNNHPDVATWWRKFIAHAHTNFLRSGRDDGPRWARVEDAAKDRLAFVETRSTLGAGLRERGAR